MFAVRTSLSGLIVFAVVQGVVAADPIVVNVWGSIDGHNISQSVTLSDPSQPLGIGPFDKQLFPTVGPNGYSGSGILDSNFVLDISAGPPGSPAAADTVALTGDVVGSYAVSTPLLPNMNGAVYSVVTGTNLYLAPGTTSAEVPPYLADLLNHPDRVDYHGYVTGMVSDSSILQTTLGIAPPVDPNAVVPAPEPSMLATAMMAVASLAIARRWRSRSC